jgi:hypothetical protein
MFERRFPASDGQHWRVWAVRPASVVDERRKRRERRVRQEARIPDPPGVERRSGQDRRTTGDRPAHLRQSHVLPEAWRDGWLVFESDDQPLGETRRLPNLPADWETCSDDRLRQYLAQASAARRRSA